MPTHVRFGAAGMVAMLAICIVVRPATAQLAAASIQSDVNQKRQKIESFLASHKCLKSGEESQRRQLLDEGNEAQNGADAYNMSKPRDAPSVRTVGELTLARLQDLKPCPPPAANPAKPLLYKPPVRGGDDIGSSR